MEYKKDYKKPYKKSLKKTDKVVYKTMRGPLSKLMSEDEKASAGIHELSYDFGCRITRLFAERETGSRYGGEFCYFQISGYYKQSSHYQLQQINDVVV